MKKTEHVTETANPRQDQGAVVDLPAVLRVQTAAQQIAAEVGKVVVGQTAVIEELLICLLAGGHGLLVGVPGLAKTLLVRSLAETLSLTFNRIQFTPDLMPADVTGTEVIQEDKTTGIRELRFIPGPVFANVLLADEINRTPPKTQSALLEAMQEHQVTVGGQRHPLPAPFFVLATQNPIEQEGTYPLPEAQRDRFLFEVRVEYPSEAEEFQIVRRTTAGRLEQLQHVANRADLQEFHATVRQIPVADHVVKFALSLVRRTRPDQPDAPPYVKQYVSWGSGPRGSQYLVLAAKARAAIRGQACATVDDLRAIALPVLRHRVLTNFHAESDGIKPEEIVRRLMES